YITIAYDSWTKIKPADAAHKVGHVRLAVNNNTNGTILTVEAAGADWRVSYRSFSYYDLTNYTPRYYRDITDEAITVQPELALVSFSDDIQLSWTLADVANLAGFDLEYWLNDIWNNYEPDQLIAPDQTGISLNFNSGLPIFFRTCTVSTDQVESSFSDSYGCYDSGSSARILIVDGFDRISGSYSKSSHEFAMTIGKSLSNSNLSFETAANEAVISGSVDLMDFAAVIWLLGDESTVDQTFNSAEQDIVKDYLKLGGKLFISGSEIGWDLDDRGTTDDRIFIKDYLKVLLDEDNSGHYTVIGAVNTVFDSLILHYDDGYQGIYKEDYPDSFLPQPGTEILLSYGNGQTAACGFKGVFPNGIQTGAVVIMGFPIETIYDPDEQALLLIKILEYFEISPATEPPIPFEFILHGNYPNPFNIRTHFAFTTSHELNVKVKVFNLLGQQVATIAEQLYSADTHSIPYNANGLASGLYLYSLEAGAHHRTGKFVLIK
ncbi:MAG: T9SS type A sorting domain-containing protein, partial [Candidatus Marinimicrobia bacterium]|nr:T9SS type A sorting domain-containing protein [Candidatus Neomarinimicrobiota bacterium]